jgi:DNA-binding NarL/FixJ family response regulator
VSERMQTILLVDDDCNFHRDFAAVLPESYRLVSAYNPSEALAILSAVRPHVVVLDLFLPSATVGEECEASIRLLIEIKQQWKLLPVLVMTDGLITPHVHRCQAIGAEGVICKSSPIRVVLDEVRSCMIRARTIARRRGEEGDKPIA